MILCRIIAASDEDDGWLDRFVQSAPVSCSQTRRWRRGVWWLRDATQICTECFLRQRTATTYREGPLVALRFLIGG